MVKVISEAEFKSEVLDSDVPVLVDFYAEWCGPCKMMAPVLDQVSTKYEGKMKVVKINTDENPNTSMTYQITGIPCLIIFKDGSEAQRLVGFRPAGDLVKEIDNFLA